MEEALAQTESKEAREPGQREQPPRRSLSGVLIAAGLFLLAKFKFVFGLLKVLPAGKFLVTSLSMLAMIAFESQRSGWLFGVGFVVLILLHELGHGYAMRQAGVEAGWPIFIPFFGAMIAMKGAPRDRSVEAHIAYGGPLAGAAASLVAAGLGLVLHSSLLVALAYTGFFLNLFNLTPMSPLDGGRIAQAFSRRAWIVGLVILGAMLIFTQAIQLLLIAAMGLPNLFRKDADAEREALAPEVQRDWAIRYFGLCAFLAAGIFFSGRMLGRV